MANTNAFVTWATAVGANILSSSAYAAATIRQQGAQQGLADPVTFNNAMRQASVVAAMIAQFTADNGPSNVNDDGNVATLEAQFISALDNIIAEATSSLTEGQNALLHYGGTDTGTANAYVFASPTPTISVYSAGLVILARFANACTGASTINAASLGVKTIARPDGSALQSGDIKASEIGFLVYDGTEFQLLAILPSSTSVPTATTTSNGIVRVATLAECEAGATSGSVPASVTPEGLASYAQPKWTSVVRSASNTETAYNEFIEITAAANCTIGLMTPVGVAGKYVVWNNSAVAQNVSTPAGNFVGGSDYGSAQTYIVIPAGAFALIDSDLTNYIARSAGVASTSNRGVVRIATSVEATNGVTSGSAPAAMTPEDTALYVAGHVATTTARGIARQATNSEALAGATSGSIPAFMTPEDDAAALGHYLPLAGGTMTGPLITARDPQSGLEVANKEYVDSGRTPVPLFPNVGSLCPVAGQAGGALIATGSVVPTGAPAGSVWADLGLTGAAVITSGQPTSYFHLLQRIG
jgi:hypothetical protein